MKTRLFSNILLVTMTMSLTAPAFAQSGDEENIINAGSGINQLSENIQSLLEPVGGGLVSSDDPMNSFGGLPGDGDGTTTGEEIPVDGGLSLLLAAGAAYGGRRVRRRKEMK
jgi:hypothetical protein